VNAVAALRARAYAKVNLALEVLGRREDGYHEIVSVVQTISLHDVVECWPGSAIDVRTEPPIVEPSENLVARAAELLAREVGRRVGAEILVRKRIPLAAGLGGGSSDAATTLRLLDRLWETRLGRSALSRLAATLGSDVPLFLVGGAVLIRGRGELVEPIAAPSPFWLALACPSRESYPCWPPAEKTGALYAALRADDRSDGARTLAFADRLRAGRSPLDEQLTNAFDRPADAVYPGFPDLRQRLAEAAGAPLRLTGAGPSLFALFATRPEAVAAARRMARLGVPGHVARNVGRSRIRIDS
jgi:4-diphosphocytidyl-2-C-methyl-D-erythritol kinase